MDDLFAAEPGQPIDLRPGLQMVLAPNPSPMTGPGTNTYLLGSDSLAIIDPGPASDAHLAALMQVIGGRRVSHIIVTHSHLDHSPLAKPLSDQTGAPVLAFGDTTAGRSPVMTRLASEGMAGGGEGLDLHFQPDVLVSDGEVIVGTDWTLKVMHTPGHLGNHIALVWDDAVFVGDLVMGWSTSLVSPPDGDMEDFLNSCRRLAGVAASVHYSGHGAPIQDPDTRLATLIKHREARTSAILGALGSGPATVPGLVNRIYEGLAPGLAGAAGRNVFAHLVALETQGRVAADPRLHPDALFALTGG